MAAKLRIVRVVTASYVVQWHLGSTLKRLPRDFEVCVAGEDVSAYRDIYPGVKWVDIEIKRKIGLLSDLLSLISLCRLFREYRPDIVHSIMHKAALLTAIAAFICRVPVRINTFTGQYWATKKGLPWVIYYLSDRITNLLNTICLTDSPSQSKFLFEHKISHAGKPLPVLLKGSLSGVEIEKFNLPALDRRVSQLRSELGLTSSNFVFIFLARKTKDKGAIDILKAFSLVSAREPEARLLFVGPDESEGELETLRASRPHLFDKVIDVNRRVEDHEVYLAASDLLCLPSYKEGFGSIVIDAAALGVPTVGSNISGLVDSIEDGNTGVLFPAGDVDSLAEAMQNFLENTDGYASMRLASRARVEKYFTADLLYEALRAFYVDLAARRGH